MDKAELGLYELLIERLLADDAVDDAMSGLILAAWSGADALADALAGRGAPTAEPPGETEVEHPDVYLAAVHVEGFRGIGRPATLQLAPGPGLTLVTGRNGSGKSSFAEAAELVMTGRNERWAGKNAVWRDGWRSLHSRDDASVAVDLTVAGTNGTTKVQRRWTQEDKLEGGRWTRQEPKAKVQDFDGSAWGASMQTYRPFLSYSELGALIDGKPTELHDAVHDLLGLGALTATQTRLKAARKPLADRARDASAERKAIRTDLASADDPRIVEALALLKPTSPDLGRLAGLGTARRTWDGSPDSSLLPRIPAAMPQACARSWTCRLTSRVPASRG
ncbi:AAA family ATPase [Pseudonocardia spirodelae]|uniref:Nuclease SbcCD subunit C n=1 Tax=Pseudonocardia spirodelae TaxID=3133431 RepID=A0ABU8T0F2_9PSEU